MTSPATIELHIAAPDASPQRVQRSAGLVWDGFVALMWIGVATMVCGFIVAQQFGAPIAIALAAHADPQGSGRGYVDRIEWAKVGDRSSLRVYPTAAGRRASTHFDRPDQAWAEVLKLAPEADSPGMREQFTCHWRFAELAHHGKTSWNLEPWRPLVGGITMIMSRCNPGGNEEAY
jgi:hypothetical protein